MYLTRFISFYLLFIIYSLISLSQIFELNLTAVHFEKHQNKKKQIYQNYSTTPTFTRYYTVFNLNHISSNILPYWTHKHNIYENDSPSHLFFLTHFSQLFFLNVKKSSESFLNSLMRIFCSNI
jgi:hypothetical protein